MKNHLLISCCLLSFFLLGSFALNAQTNMETRAKEGEKVWIMINKVKADVKEEYEKYMTDVFYDLLLTTQTAKLQEQYKTSRWLTGTKENEDGTWNYVFIMDPVVEDGDYRFEPLFMEKYEEEEAKKLIAQYNSFMAEPMTFYELTQLGH